MLKIGLLVVILLGLCVSGYIQGMDMFGWVAVIIISAAIGVSIHSYIKGR